MKRFFLFSFFVAFSLQISATHNRAGEITYRHISGNTYEFTVYTYTKSTAPADRPFLPINWGDASGPDSLERAEINLIPDRDAQENIYIKEHTFPGSGEYQVCITDPNRNGGILNIDNGNSLFVVFAIQTTIRISAAIEPNNSVFFTNLPLQDACLFQPWVFNPGAVDIDGDSLSYRLVNSMGSGCVSFEDGFYVFPDQVDALGFSPDPTNNINMDPITGTILWQSPQRVGEYNIAFVVEEWRNGIKLGEIMRDMQILVDVCNNTPPEIGALPDTCVEAGTEINFLVTADDPENQNVTLNGYGLPFEVSNAATLIQEGLMPPVEAEFSWKTECENVRLAPYQVTFQATDNDPVPLVDIVTMNITVVAPAPENLLAEAVGSSIQLSWEPSICDEAIGYKIYRRIGPFGFEPSACETGVPEYTGFTLIDTTLGLNTTSFLDDDEVLFGRQNCYMVVACFPDGAESYASNESCAEILFGLPIIKKNSIGITDAAGIDTVSWRNPIDLDLDVFPGPYQYKVLRSQGYNSADEIIYETPTENDLQDLETTFTPPPFTNTEDTAHTYRIELFSNGAFAARSNLASSIFLELIPNDNRIELKWREETPWLNFEYDIFRRGENDLDFIQIATIDTLGFLDTGLQNNEDYCYFIVAKGSYFSDLENDTLINYSQRICSAPFDRNPPCPPELFGDADCVEMFTDLEWTNPNVVCDDTDDVSGYNVYFKPTVNGEFVLIESIEGEFSTELFQDLIEENSISGCYAVTALDSLNLWPDGSLVRNESDFSNEVCFDNCPAYAFPNVFTPNGDGRNDILLPFPVRAIDSVEFSIFNRWGGLVFETTDPRIRWGGENKDSGELVSDGTYFYVCRAFTRRLTGIESIEISGYVTIFADESTNFE
ncbi:MAG: gliding motility-associated C-terminal domain-containing protein [Flavobacteriales bacterium]|nr:gliding motility-associated C-terminal domain-containing protein [Flavobacteriales bacterium]